VPMCGFHCSGTLGKPDFFAYSVEPSGYNLLLFWKNTNGSTPCHCGHGYGFHGLQGPAPSTPLPQRGPCMATQCSGYQVCTNHNLILFCCSPKLLCFSPLEILLTYAVLQLRHMVVYVDIHTLNMALFIQIQPLLTQVPYRPSQQFSLLLSHRHCPSQRYGHHQPALLTPMSTLHVWHTLVQNAMQCLLGHSMVLLHHVEETGQTITQDPEALLKLLLHWQCQCSHRQHL
jgi:hypothetical protein